MQDKHIKVKDVCKCFGKTQVLNHVNRECNQGEINRDDRKKWCREDSFI